MSSSKEQSKIIYSLRVVRQLMEKGYAPIGIYPNPVEPQFNCWAFEPTDDFLLTLDEVLSEVSQHGR